MTHTTSVGRKYFGLTLTLTVPVLESYPISSSPMPFHLKILTIVIAFSSKIDPELFTKS